MLPFVLLAPLALQAQDPNTLVAAASATAPATLLRPASAQHSLTALRWIRRATLATSCIAGTVVNNWALHQVASEPNLILSGPFVSNGQPRYGLLLGIGVGTCAFSVIGQETNLFGRETRRADITNIVENLGATGYSSWETYQYLSLRDQAHAALMGK